LLAFWRFDIGEEGEGGRGEMVWLHQQLTWAI
jgi:hypothetical protein